MKKITSKPLKKWYGKIRDIERKIEEKELKELLAKEDFKEIRNQIPRKVKTLCFLIPNMNAYAGGHTSVLRLGTAAANHGYEVIYATYGGQDKKSMEENARQNLYSYKGRFCEKKDIFSLSADVVIATNWKSAYMAKQIAGYKMYFIQDYEPYFYSYGDYYLLARETYQFQFHMVSLGQWNQKIIARETGSMVKDVIDFPYEQSEYSFQNREFESYSMKKELTFCVYLKEESKRLPLILSHLLRNLQQEFQRHGKKLKLLYFGLEPYVQLETGVNLGKLGKKQLLELYQTSDFGLVASVTNISLVPYEMAAAGLPLIEWKEGSFSAFFPEEAAILTGFDAVKLYEKIDCFCRNPKELYRMQERALHYLKGYSWAETGRQFCSILKNLETQGEVERRDGRETKKDV